MANLPDGYRFQVDKTRQVTHAYRRVVLQKKARRGWNDVDWSYYSNGWPAAEVKKELAQKHFAPEDAYEYSTDY